MLKRHSGFTIVETLIAFLILMLVISITVTGSAWVVTLEKKAVVKSDIYDVAYSYAEEILATKYVDLDTLADDDDDEVELNGFTYLRDYDDYSEPNFFESGWEINYVILKVELKDENNEFGDEEYYVKMTVIPQQRKEERE